MGLLWYVAAILIWWLIGGFVGSGLGSNVQFRDFGMATAMTAFFFASWWFPYTTWLALGEIVLFQNYPSRRTPFVVFAGLSFSAYSAIALTYPRWSDVWPLIIWPAAVVTAIYLVRRSVRPAPYKTHQLSSDSQSA